MTRNNDDHTEIIDMEGHGLSGDYDESQDFAMNPTHEHPETLLDVSTLQYQESMRLDNLPSSDKDGQHWVSSFRYEEIYNNMVDAEESKAVFERNYARAYDQNNILRTNLDEAKSELEKLRNSTNASRAYTDEKEAELRIREEDLNARDKNFKPLKWTLIVLSTVCVVTSLVFGFMWMDQRTDSVSSGQRDTALQEQVRTLQGALEQERTDHDGTREEVRSLSAQVEELKNQVEEGNQDQEKSNEEIKNRDREIDRLVAEVEALDEENNQLANQQPETVTRTFVQRSPGDTQTVTETATATVTTTAPSTVE